MVYLKYLALLLIPEALYSIAFSHDQIELFQLGRLLRLILGALIVGGIIRPRHYRIVGPYITLEAIGSWLVSPNKGEFPFELGWAFRMAYGIALSFAARGD
ncbi:hypothetical protein HY995_03230 [Candidatus Micrarchaeota archaeon]|nr:hypothetical protein [Candidatus Micrarchaeota archaeon]MBI5177074.1 hypothetical protein [Candidatus Micrarchaeota archaeon]